MSTVASSDRVKVQLVFAGIEKINSKGEIANEYFVVRDGVADISDPRYFSKNKKGHGGRPGTVYEFEATSPEVKSIFPTTFKYVGHLADDSPPCTLVRTDKGFGDEEPKVIPVDNATQVAVWQARNEARRLEKDIEAAEEKGKNLNVIRRYTEPLRDVYWSLGSFERQVFLAQVVGSITGHRKPKKEA